MKYNPIMWKMMTGRMKKGIKEILPDVDADSLIRSAKPIYQDLLSKIDGISEKNPMAMNITTSFIIIAIWLASDRRITVDQMYQVMEITMDWGVMKKMYGGYDLNTEKGVAKVSAKMRKSAQYNDMHPEETNTFIVGFDEDLHRDGFYYYFTQCPIANFCKENGYEEINPVLCRIDYLTAKLMHGKLHRQTTIADGGEICDYWVTGDKAVDPQ